MCRKNQLWGLAVLSLGLGLLFGCWLESEPSRICFGVALVVGGFCILQKQ